jgi:subtilisin family serine protease
MASKRGTKPGAEAPASPDTTATTVPDGSDTVAEHVQTRPAMYLIAPRAGVAGQMRPMSSSALHAELEGLPGVTVRRKLKPRGMSLLSASGPGEVHEIIVAEMTHEHGERLRANAPPDVIIERDEKLRHAAEMGASLVHAPVSATARITADVRLKIVDSRGRPVPKATVIVYGLAFPAQGQTADDGTATITVAGGALDTVRAIYVKPLANCWDRFVERPHLAEGTDNVIALKRLADTFEGFPEKGMLGWGQKLMGLDRIDPSERGAGVKIGIIDSGCDNTHPQLRHVSKGADLVSDDGGAGWTNDEMAHGTHCAGIIGARSDVQAGITGFAPAAEIHAYKVFPGGRFSDLIEALDMAMEEQVDVLNMSLGSDQGSELVEQKLAAAVASGIVCIVAAGNSSGPVQFPGRAPLAITVGAIGKSGEYPGDSYHAQTLGESGADENGLFSARFTCFGPEVQLSAPGVAIVSTVPGGHAAWDGTSMAAPHVAGLAALLIAHHPFVRDRPRAMRVQAVRELLRAIAVPIVQDRQRGGAGLPIASRALAGTGTSANPAAAAPAPAPAAAVAGGEAGAGGAANPPFLVAPQALVALFQANPGLLQSLLARQAQAQAQV